jgi:signal peptidase II
MKIINTIVPIVAFVVVADQLSKFAAVARLQEASIDVIPGLFSLTLAYNKGAAFGFLSGLPDGVRQFALAATTVVAIAAVLFMLLRYYRDSVWGCVSIGLILGGALGNIIDRVRLGMVVDFLDVYWDTLHWPTFNVADSCICIGVAVLFFLKGDKTTAS